MIDLEDDFRIGGLQGKFYSLGGFCVARKSLQGPYLPWNHRKFRARVEEADK